MSHTVKMHYLLKYSSLFPGIRRQTKYILMMTKEGSNFKEYVLSSSLSIYFTLIANVLKDYDAAFFYNC